VALPKPLLAILAVLKRPMFGTRVVPPDATVPAADFPEDEYPVYCPKCDYSLRGLSTDRCPECGEPFDRGRLLVVQYVRERDHRLWQRGGSGYWASRLAMVTLGFLGLYIVGTHAVALLVAPLAGGAIKPTARQVEGALDLLVILLIFAWWARLLVLLIILACAGVLVRSARRNARKRRRVLEAIMEP